MLFKLTQRLLYTKWRDAGEAPKLHLFGQLKRITREWLDKHLVCRGGTYPALLLYQDLADIACNRITAAITAAFAGERPIKGVLDSYNPVGSTAHVRFNTSRTHRWAKRIRLTAAIVTIIGGIPGTLVTLGLVADWAAPSEPRSMREREPRTGEATGASWEDSTSVCRPSSTLK